jgi:ABC-type sulfate transport system permease subunit
MSEAKVVAAAAAAVAVARIKFKGRKIVNTFIQSV